MKKLFSALLCVCVAGTLAAADIGERLMAVLPAKTVSELVSQGVAQKSIYRERDVQPTLAPATVLSGEAEKFWSGDDATFFVESLYLYKKRPGTETAVGADIGKISIILRSLSKLEGIEYYSTSRKTMRTLYEKSYAIDNATAKKRIPDQTGGSADGVSIFAVQKDLTFGEYVYEYSYRQTEDTVAFFSRNVDAMKLKVIKVVDPERLRASLVVQDLGDYLLVYGLTRADFLAVPGIESKINASFSTRADAVYKWFIREYEKQ